MLLPLTVIALIDVYELATPYNVMFGLLTFITPLLFAFGKPLKDKMTLS